MFTKSFSPFDFERSDAPIGGSPYTKTNAIATSVFYENFRKGNSVFFYQNIVEGTRDGTLTE